jgi:hypothetical protein
MLDEHRRAGLRQPADGRSLDVQVAIAKWRPREIVDREIGDVVLFPFAAQVLEHGRSGIQADAKGGRVAIVEDIFALPRVQVDGVAGRGGESLLDGEPLVQQAAELDHRPDQLFRLVFRGGLERGLVFPQLVQVDIIEG